MNLSPIDIALLGFVAAVVAGFGLYGSVNAGVRAVGFNKGDATELVATGVSVFLLSIVAFGVTWRIINKFVSFLVPQPTNALVGALSGAFKSLVFLLLLAGVGFVRPGTYAQSGLSKQSQVVHTLAAWVDSFYAGHHEEISEPMDE